MLACSWHVIVLFCGKCSIFHWYHVCRLCLEAPPCLNWCLGTKKRWKFDVIFNLVMINGQIYYVKMREKMVLPSTISWWPLGVQHFKPSTPPYIKWFFKIYLWRGLLNTYHNFNALTREKTYDGLTFSDYISYFDCTSFAIFNSTTKFDMWKLKTCTKWWDFLSPTPTIRGVGPTSWLLKHTKLTSLIYFGTFDLDLVVDLA